MKQNITNITQKTSFILGLLCICFLAYTPLQAQDQVFLGEQEGIKVSYRLDFIRSIDKKKASKSKDEYRVTAYIENASGQDLYGRGSLAGVRITNLKSAKAAGSGGISSGLLNTDSVALNVVKAGQTYQSARKFKIQKGLKPTVMHYVNTANFKDISQHAIMITPIVINGMWQVENAPSSITLRYDVATKNITQTNANGDVITWLKATKTSYQRSFTGLRGTNATVIAPNSMYSATLTFVSLGELRYTNSEGISVRLKKQ